MRKSKMGSRALVKHLEHKAQKLGTEASREAIMIF